MMKRHVIRFVPTLLLLLISDAGAQEASILVSIKGNLTTASRLFPNANSTSGFERADYFPLENSMGFGVEVRYVIPQTQLAFGISSEYIRARVDKTSNSQSGVPVEDGYRVVPVELTGYFLIPVSGPSFGLYMGGGCGAYFGRRLYRIGDVEAVALNSSTGFGIHVLGGMSYRFTDWFALELEMKFRDVQFESTDRFTVSRINYNGRVVNINQDPRYSRVRTDGVVFQLGTAFNF